MRLFVFLYLGYCVELVYPFVFHSTRLRYAQSKSSPLAASSKTVDVSSLKKRLSSATENVGTASSMFNLQAIRSSIEDLETAASQDGFWDDADNAQKLMQELESQKSTLSRIRRWEEALADCKTALELCSADDEIVGNEFAIEADEILSVLEHEVEALKLEQSLSGPFDKADCRVVITAGAGGTDAQDWAQVSNFI
jgi:peptide chain release factor 2